MSACGCCDQPPCPAPVLECESVSGSASKVAPCGFLHEGKRWLVRTITQTGSYSYDFQDIGGCAGEGSHNTTEVSTYDENCEVSTVCSGSRTTSQDCVGDYDDDNPPCSGTLNSDCTWGGDGLCFWGGIFDPNGGITTTTVYSSENPPETTEELIDRTIEALAEFPDTWSGSCSTLRNLSPDESSFSVRRARWRIKHAPTGTCYLKVWIRRRFQPEGGGSETITSLTPYTWTGSGNPCLADPTKPPTHEDNSITSSATTEDEPATDGENFIEIVKWSCLEGYEPPDDGSANGFPPAEEE